MLRMTGRYGDGWLPSLLPGPGEYRKKLSVIEEAANQAGRSTEHFVPGQLVPFVLGKAKDQMMEKILRSPIAAATCMLMPDAKWKEHGLSHPLGEGHDGFFKIMPHSVSHEEVYKVLDNLTPELVESSFWVGTKADLLEKCANLVDEGARHLAMIDMTPLFDEMSLSGLIRQIQLIRAVGRL
jgi:phthiodiolone/phenolphthiodiolone dimycocerosates ketoreductase